MSDTEVAATDEVRIAADRVNIQDVIARYAAAVDARRWDDLDRVFAPGAVVDFEPNGGIRDTFPAIKEYLRTAMGVFAAYQHYMTNFVIDPRGDEATARWYVFTQMISIVDGDDSIIADGGYYDASFVRTPEGWRISALSGGIVWVDEAMARAFPRPAWYGVSTSRY